MVYRLLAAEDNYRFDTNYWVDIIKMTYSTESKFRKLMDTARKTGIDAASKKVKKTAESTADLIENKNS